MATTLSRRAFGAGMVAAGVGLTIRFALADDARPAARLTGVLAANPRLDGWVRIAADGTATICTGRVELGQGVRTALLQIAAEELDLPMARMTLVSGDTERTPNEGQTAGSQSIHYGGEALGQACADARATLVGVAAQAWSLPAGRLVVGAGVITAPDGRSMGYGEAAQRASFARDVDPAARRKDPTMQTVVGTSVPRVDIPAKVFGEAAYVHDLRLAGMLFGAIARPPAYGARLLKAELGAADRYPGVKTVVDGSFVGVIARREEQARAAAAAIAAASQWQLPVPLFGGRPALDYLRTTPHEVKIVSARGDVAQAQGRTLRASFERAYQKHASIGASCAVAQVQDGKLTVWSHTQGVFPLRADLMAVFGLPADRVHVIHMPGSGCYGHNGADDVALDAALLAAAVPGRPVRVLWTHDEEMTWEPHGSTMAIELEAVLTDAGRIAAWTHRVWSFPHDCRPGKPDGTALLSNAYRRSPLPQPRLVNGALPAGAADRNAVPGSYDIPAHRVELHFNPLPPIRTSALRTLGAYANIFAAESFMDDLAAAAGTDPVAFRRRHGPDPRLIAVMDKAVALAQWTPRPAGPRPSAPTLRGTGLGVARYKNSEAYVAVVATVEVDTRTGEITPLAIHGAVDTGRAVSPDGVLNQVEGGIIQSTSQTLLEAAAHDGHIMTGTDYQAYPIIGFDLVPPVTVALIDRPDQPSVGVGEAAHGPTAAALGNAVFDAIGKRVPALPIAPERVLAALKA